MLMSKTKPLALLLSLTAASLLSACDPVEMILDPLRPADTLCADMGEGHCTVPEPDHFKRP